MGSSADVHGSDAGIDCSSSLADGSNVAGGGDRVPAASSLPSPSILQPGFLSTMLMVLFGFGGENEFRFQRFLVQRNLAATTMGLNLRCLVVSVRLLKFVRESEHQLAVLFAILVLMPVYVCRRLCRKEWADHLGFGILWMILSRATATCLPVLGLGDVYGIERLVSYTRIPIEGIIAPMVEHMPIILVWPFHHTFWLMVYFRNELLEPEDQCGNMFLLAGYIAGLIIRVSMDVIDRRAYIREVAARHSS